MTNLQTAQIPQIKIHNGMMATTSRNIAQVFGKNHRDVLRDVKSLDIPQDFAERNFALCSYKGKNGQSYKMHNVTRDGFTLLAMGFTGKKAMQFKLGYIEAFNTMETELLKKYEQPALSSTISPEQKLAIRDAVTTKVYAKYPDGKRPKGFSAEYRNFYHAFGISKYEELPADKFDKAIEWLQGEIVEPKNKFIPAMPYEVRPILKNKRFLLSYDYEGRENIKPIEQDTYVMTPEQMLKAINEPNGIPVSTDELAAFALATIERLQHRSNYYEHKALN